MEFISIGGETYVVLGTVSVDSGYTTEELKSMWVLADTVLRNGNQYYICHKTIIAEFEDI
jgi:hypothetical protein